MKRFAVFGCDVVLLLTMFASQLAAQDNRKLKEQYIRFARLYSMDGGSSVMQEYWMRSAPKRAERLDGEQFSEPAIRKAASEFKILAKDYYKSWEDRNNTRVDAKEYERRMESLNPFAKKSDLDIIAELKAARANEKEIWEAAKNGFLARSFHGQQWKTILPVAKKVAGLKTDQFPLRLGLTYAYNTSNEALTNVTLAIETNSCVEIPGRHRLHVVFFERLSPGEWVTLPAWLVNKQWKSNSYVAGTDVLRCSVWSDQASAEGVVFDLKQVQPAAKGQAASWGLFPDQAYTGKYDMKTPWTLPPVPGYKLRLIAAGGTWRGKDNASGNPRQLVIVELIGPHFIAIDLDPNAKATRIVEGQLQDGKIDWEPMIANQGELGFPHWGTVKDGRMELSYGPNRTPKGTVRLDFAEKKVRKGK